MAELEFKILSWIGANSGSPEEQATMASLQMSAPVDSDAPFTEVEDTLAQTVRPHVNLPLVLLAQWLLVNWWRIRWEARPTSPQLSWRQSHCLSGIDGANAWPPLEFSSDGDFVQLQMDAEESAHSSTVRYLRTVHVDIAATHFETAIDRLLDVVQGRLNALLPAYTDIADLRNELAEERGTPRIARQCRWQARAGIDPGDADDAWLERAAALASEAGLQAGDEIMGILPDLEDGIRSAESLVDAMKRSRTTVDLSWVTPAPERPSDELPWQAGARLARQLRSTRGLGTGPVENETLSELLGASIPLAGEYRKSPLAGGIRNRASHGRTKILLTSSRSESQRFYFARLLGAAHSLLPDEHVIPVTTGNTALQKLERSFAQEFLCPWASLDTFTDEHGLHDEALAGAAEHFQVSEWLIRSTLVNRGKLARRRLPDQLQ
jgi:hypothetical protein